MTKAELVDQVAVAAARTGEPVWQLPLDSRYRGQLDSPIADIKNVGGPNAGAITAALFLAEFVAGRPWAHLDIAGPAQNDAASSWRPQGCTGFGTRLLLDLALDFRRPAGSAAGGGGAWPWRRAHHAWKAAAASSSASASTVAMIRSRSAAGARVAGGEVASAAGTICSCSTSARQAAQVARWASNGATSSSGSAPRT